MLPESPWAGPESGHITLLILVFELLDICPTLQDRRNKAPRPAPVVILEAGPGQNLLFSQLYFCSAGASAAGAAASGWAGAGAGA